MLVVLVWDMSRMGGITWNRGGCGEGGRRWGFGRELSHDVAEDEKSARSSTFSLPWWT